MEIGDFRDIKYEGNSSGIVTLTLSTPKRKNALSAVTFLELFWAIDHFENDPEAAAMIITGAKDPSSENVKDEAFSSGGYFSPDAFEGLSEEVMAQIDLNDIAQKKATLKLFKCHKPIIAAINGLAIGGAFTMSLVGCDLIYMSEHAWVQLPFAKLGLVPELASSFLLPRLIGLQKTKEIIFFSKKLTADDCLELNLVNAVLPHEELLGYARKQAELLIPPKGAGHSIQQIKKILHQPYIEALENSLDLENEGLSDCLATEDFLEALQARKEKRAPVYKGK